MRAPSFRVASPAEPAHDCPVHVGRGLLGRLGMLVRELVPAHIYAVIADDHVARLYGERALAGLREAGLRADLLGFPPGEASKGFRTWADLCERMLAAGVGRDAAVVALGGGVAGDLAGFVAATYMRGLPLVMVPTSLLAMIDSSIGGKTGIDAGAAKNAIGAFHPPRLVVADPDVLQTLEPAQFRAGLAEAVKVGAALDDELFARLEAEPPTPASDDLEPLIATCGALKAAVVADDPYEAGRREILNFGHTAGHALEALSGYTRPHGEAVALGMRIEARLGEALGVTEPGTVARLDDALDGCRLPRLVGPDAPDGARLLEAAASDKKARRGSVRWVLLRRIGEVAREAGGAWSHALDPADTVRRLDETLEALRGSADVADSAP